VGRLGALARDEAEALSASDEERRVLHIVPNDILSTPKRSELSKLAKYDYDSIFAAELDTRTRTHTFAVADFSSTMTLIKHACGRKSARQVFEFNFAAMFPRLCSLLYGFDYRLSRSVCQACT
jgi:hypothetical protein